MRAIATTLFALMALGCAAFYEGKSDVVELTPANFDEKVLKSDGLWLVEFYAPWCGHCKSLAPEWKKAAKALKGSVKIAAVDADKHRELGTKFGVSGFPTIKVFGADKTKPTEYDGGRTADAIVKTALAEAQKITNKRLGIKDDEAPKKEQQQQKAPPPAGGFYEGTDVVELTDDTFEKEVLNPEGKGGWLVEFYAPWCGHCKSLAPEWKKAATALAGSIKIAAIDAQAHRTTGEKYKVTGFPTIKFFPPGGAEPVDYDAGRTAEAIIEYGHRMAEKYPAAPPQVNQIKDDAALKELCPESKNLCVIFIVPHVIDTTAAGRNKLIDMFASLSGKLRSRGVAFGWIIGGEHTKFEEAFGIYSAYPTFLAYKPKPKKDQILYHVHRGTFNEDGIVTSVKKILDGKTGLSERKELPKLSSGVALWDGADYKEPADEEL
jgi:protein disulfide-isomerase A6